MSEPEVAAQVSDQQTEQTKVEDPGRKLRFTVLFSALFLMLFALWYDYRVARPSVESAFDRVAVMNGQINSSSRPAMTSQDVQFVVGMKPDSTFKTGHFQVEVYTWNAGLPFRTHDYYAVYVPRGGQLNFMRHYKFGLPMNELTVMRRPRLATTNLGESIDMAEYERYYRDEFSEGDQRHRREMAAELRHAGEMLDNRPERPRRPALAEFDSNPDDALNAGSADLGGLE